MNYTPKIAVFDLDGTLTDATHRLHHITGEEKNWDAFFGECDKDEPIEEVIALMHSLNAAGHDIAIVSGRSEKVRDKTELWLKENDINCHFLLQMRKKGDFRQDHEIKREWLHNFPHRDDILFVFEDRQQVVDMWRKEGLLCCQVAPGNF